MATQHFCRYLKGRNTGRKPVTEDLNFGDFIGEALHAAILAKPMPKVPIKKKQRKMAEEAVPISNFDHTKNQFTIRTKGAVSKNDRERFVFEHVARRGNLELVGVRERDSGNHVRYQIRNTDTGHDSIFYIPLDRALEVLRTPLKVLGFRESGKETLSLPNKTISSPSLYTKNQKVINLKGKGETGMVGRASHSENLRGERATRMFLESDSKIGKGMQHSMRSHRRGRKI